MIVIRDGTVLTPDGWVTADIAVSDGLVGDIGVGFDGDVVIDASGCLVGPGFVDMHTHLRDPGQTWKEDIASGSRAAAAGGFTAVVAMPNTDPPLDAPKMVRTVTALGAETGLVDVVPAAALTAGRLGSSPVDAEALYESGVRIFTDDGDPVSDAAVLRELMGVIAGLAGAVVAQHAEDTTLTGGGHMHEGTVSRSLGVGGLPAEAETNVVRRDLDLVRTTGARYHCQHVSAKETAEVIRAAKTEGLPVTAEVCPHHLSFTDEDVRGLNPNFKMYPPLRSEDDRAALVAALADGTIDVVATDHAPHQVHEKDVDFASAPRGVIGLETAAAVTWATLQDRDALFRVLSTKPAAIAGLDDHGQPLTPALSANLVVFDPDKRWKVSHFESKSANSPYLGHELQGKAVATIYQGTITHRDGDR